MKTTPMLSSLSRSFGQFPALPVAAAVSNLLGWSSRRRRRGPTSSAYLIAGGVLAGAAAALLLNPWNGRDLRTRVGKLLGGGAGKLVGQQIGAHPLGTAKVIRTSQELLSGTE